MAKFLIDVNLPYYFSLWSTSEYQHVRDINDEWSDSEIWQYAKKNSLTIVTKDADFSDRMILTEPPPRVIHIKMGNLKMKEFFGSITKIWEDAIALSHNYKLIRVYPDRLEGIN